MIRRENGGKEIDLELMLPDELSAMHLRESHINSLDAEHRVNGIFSFQCLSINIFFVVESVAAAAGAGADVGMAKHSSQPMICSSKC